MWDISEVFGWRGYLFMLPWISERWCHWPGVVAVGVVGGDDTDNGSGSHRSNAGKLGLSLINGLIIVSVIGAMTFVIVLLYKYRSVMWYVTLEVSQLNQCEIFEPHLLSHSI